MMNERVRELAEQAKQYARERMAHPMDRNLFSTAVFEAKFAELIVKECADISYKIAWNDLVRGEPGSVIPLHIYNSINEHFGVEL